MRLISSAQRREAAECSLFSPCTRASSFVLQVTSAPTPSGLAGEKDIIGAVRLYPWPSSVTQLRSRPRVAVELGGRWETHDMAPYVEPRWNPGTRKVVGATGFEGKWGGQRPPAPKLETARFPAIFCTLRFGRNSLLVLGFDVQARCGWLRVAASKRRRGVTPVFTPERPPARETSGRQNPWPPSP